MPRQFVAAFALLLCIACDHATPTQPPAPPPPAPPPSHSPIARITGPSTIREGASATFSARTSTDPDGDSLHYQWDFGLGDTGPWDTLVEQGRGYQDNGVYTIQLIVTDATGNRDTATTLLTVVNVPPVIGAVWPPAQQAVGIPAGARVAYSDSGWLDTHTTIISWGDGTTDSVARDTVVQSDSMVHTYGKAGSYLVRATVRDKDGGVASDTAHYHVLVFDATERQTVAGYEVLDLGTLGGNSARPLDLNDYGQIVGFSLTASGSTHAFLWDNGVLRDLGTLGHEGSEAGRINNAGLIAGSVWSGGHGDGVRNGIAATWLNGSGTILDLMPDPYERYPTSAAALNESGDIVWTAYGHESDYAWLWRGGGWQRLGGLAHPLGASSAAAMNESGQIVGSSGAVSGGDSPGLLGHAFLWQDGVMRDQGLLGFKPCFSYPDRNCGYASATDINESEQVVGWSTASDGSVHFVLWENGTIRDLGLAPTTSQGWGTRAVINDRGQVAASSGGEAFFWSNGNPRSLGSLGGPTEVVAMNENGEVVGTSFTGGSEQHVFVWSEQRGMVDLGTGPHGFSGAWVVGISFRGDIVGLTAPCNLGYYHTCDHTTEPRAILWRNTQASASR